MSRVRLCVAINANNQKGPFFRTRDGDLHTILLTTTNMLEVLKPQATILRVTVNEYLFFSGDQAITFRIPLLAGTFPAWDHGMEASRAKKLQDSRNDRFPVLFL